jgi:hypothetical protein
VCLVSFKHFVICISILSILSYRQQNFNEIEARLVVPKEPFLAQYLIHFSKLASLNPEKELHDFMPLTGDLPDKSFAVYMTELIRWKCK